MTRKYAEGEERRRLLQEMGYDPDDPTFSVELFDTEYTPVTEMETKRDPEVNELTTALQEAITAMQRVLKLLT